MRDNLHKTTDWILVHEGGYSDHPRDPGGATNMGVIQNTYDGWRTKKGQSKRSVRHITKGEVVAIYKEQYWDKVWGDQLPNGVDYSLYDFAINSGPSRAVKFIQRLVGVKEDGVMGNVTLNAIKQSDDLRNLISDLNHSRWDWLKKLRHYSTFGKGWTRRVMGANIGAQNGDHGVIDRSIMLWDEESEIPAPVELDDGASAKTDELEPKLKRKEAVKEAVNIDNVAKIGAGSIPGWLGAASAVPEGPLQWAVAIGAVLVFAVVAFWLFKKLQ